MNLILLIVDEGGTWWSYLIAFIFFIIFMPLAIQREIRKKVEQDERYAARKGWTLEQLHEYRDKRRARTIRGSVRKDVMARDNYQCQYCGATDDLAIDHIFPFSRGGSNEADNLQVLCRACNSAKSDAIPREYTDD
tara:strand:+ start:121 stop:528 length:408 start_codon:yes stop_codon:yes gene_type:complete